jgi:hypothetical protein
MCKAPPFNGLEKWSAAARALPMCLALPCRAVSERGCRLLDDQQDSGRTKGAVCRVGRRLCHGVRHRGRDQVRAAPHITTSRIIRLPANMQKPVVITKRKSLVTARPTLSRDHALHDTGADADCAADLEDDHALGTEIACPTTLPSDAAIDIAATGQNARPARLARLCRGVRHRCRACWLSRRVARPLRNLS